MEAAGNHVAGPHLVVLRQDEMRKKGSLQCLLPSVLLQRGQLAGDLVWSKRPKQHQLRLSRRDSSAVGQVDDLALPRPVDGAVRLVHKARQPFGEPVITPRLPALRIHALLDDHPLTIICDNEAMQVEAEPVLHRRTVDLGDKAARGGEPCPVEPNPLAYSREFARRLAGMLSPPAADMDAEFA